MASLNSQEAFASDLGAEIVTLFVGKDKKKFGIHKKLLCKKAPVFEAMFNGGFKEAQEGVAYLPEDEPVAVEMLVEWLYRGNISSPVDSTIPAADRAGEAAKTLIAQAGKDFQKGFCFAEKYCIEEVMDQSLSLLIKVHKQFNNLCTFETISSGYDSTRPGSRLRCYLLRSLCYIMFQMKEKPKKSSWSTDGIKDLLKNNPDLLDDLVDAQRGQGGKPIQDPRKMPACDYHQHDSATICPYRKENIEVIITNADYHQSKKRKSTSAPKGSGAVHTTFMCKGHLDSTPSA